MLFGWPRIISCFFQRNNCYVQMDFLWSKEVKKRCSLAELRLCKLYLLVIDCNLFSIFSNIDFNFSLSLESNIVIVKVFSSNMAKIYFTGFSLPINGSIIFPIDVIFLKSWLQTPCIGITPVTVLSNPCAYKFILFIVIPAELTPSNSIMLTMPLIID